MIKHEVPAAAADIDAVVVDNQEYMEDLGDAHNASQIKNGAVGLYMNDAEAVYDASRPDFARLRVDLGLPPPPTASPQPWDPRGPLHLRSRYGPILRD